MREIVEKNLPQPGFLRNEEGDFVEDLTGQYIQPDVFIAKPIRKDHCRTCRNRIKKYSAVYKKIVIEGDLKFIKLFSASNSYCEECAKKHSGYFVDKTMLVDHVENWTENESPRSCIVYADGSTSGNERGIEPRKRKEN